jgi:hypothetical protein
MEIYVQVNKPPTSGLRKERMESTASNGADTERNTTNTDQPQEGRKGKGRE